jgi:hypothetical protein
VLTPTARAMAEPQLPLPMMQTLFFIDDLLIIVTQIS